MTRLLLSLLSLCVLGHVVAQESGVVFRDGFEKGLGAWRCRWAGKQPLLVADGKAFAGTKCAYSGPPGENRVMEHTFQFPLTGRVEVRFFDDLAKGKQQIASVGMGNEGAILAIIVNDAPHYQYRIGKDYTATRVARKQGWRLFAWECDGLATSAFIDGVKVAETKVVPTIGALSLGSFWNASTGWYDAVRVEERPPTRAAPVVEAEQIVREDAPEGKAVSITAKKGASNQALKGWDAKGHALTWYLGSESGGDCQLLLKHAGVGTAVRVGSLAENQVRIEFPSTGGWDRWQYQAVPVKTVKGVSALRLANESGSRNLDWIALIPANAPAQEYGQLLDEWLVGRARRVAAWRMTQRAARAAGLATGVPPAEPTGFRELPPLAKLRQAARGEVEGLSALRNQVLAKEAAELTGRFRVPPWSLPGPETELSRETYTRLVRYLKLTTPRFRDWPYLAGCRYHKREGSAEWDVRQNGAVALGYAAILRGPYDEKVGGVPREQLLAELIQLLRTVSVTHYANFLPTSDGKPWGNHWQSAYWAGIIGEAAWLVWDRLPEDVQLMVARMVEHAANRYNTRRPDSGYLLDTKAEENAWNSEAIALAACMFPDHPNAKLWHERARVYMINAFTRSGDRESDKVVDGKPLRERVTSVTLHEDYTLENHHRVHPDYLSCSSLNLRNALLYKAGGLPLPESMSFGARETFAVFKGLAATNGSCFYVNGQDWWPHRHDVPLMLAAFMGVLHGDREGTYLERATLDFFSKMHARFEDGSAWDPREYNYANAEEEMVMRYTELYLLHRMFGDGAKPVSKDEYLASRAGTRVFKRGGFAVHSTARKYASFTWRNGVMGLVFADDDTWLTAPYERGLVGSLTVKGKRDDKPKALRQLVRELPEGFAGTAEVSRCQGTVRQWLAMVSLPGRPVLYLERLAAATDIEVERVRTATFGILNEDAPGINPNQRALHSATGSRVVVGHAKGPSTEFGIEGTWLNVDDRLGVVTSAASGFRYQDENRYRQSRLREVLSAQAMDGVGAVAEGRTFGQAAVLVLPAMTATETQAQGIKLTTAGTVLAARLTDGTVVLANLGPEKQQGTLHGIAYELAALEAKIAAAN